ncbi:hydrocephalus-inducing protein homolog [Hirundo rustica]|uniref:hydrocephalus-inducing protein homolog n=1 Tax=Hirundo rustica TaxID=43150 RepID=UPI00267114D7|nr:hydrocephalus-inducing protein homolog [Hirundo rustica]
MTEQLGAGCESLAISSAAAVPVTFRAPGRIPLAPPGARAGTKAVTGRDREGNEKGARRNKARSRGTEAGPAPLAPAPGPPSTPGPGPVRHNRVSRLPGNRERRQRLWRCCGLSCLRACFGLVAQPGRCRRLHRAIRHVNCSRRIALCERVLNSQRIALCERVLNSRRIALCERVLNSRRIALCERVLNSRRIALCERVLNSRRIALCERVLNCLLKVTPSAFQKEMSLTTKQRLARAKKLTLPQIVQPQAKHETSHHKSSATDPEQSSFQPCPPEVVFQNYSPGQVCEIPVLLRNRDKVPHLLKVTLESLPYFKLVGPNDVYRKVPPGLYTTVRILFTPAENKDYFHKLVCITEREEFIVPIRAIGARAILDFPDQLDFSECPVKYSTQKTLLVRNIGNRAAHYQLSTQSPFSVIPAMGALDIGDAMQVTVGYEPLKAGDCSTSLVVHYDTGEDTHTSLHGRAVDVAIGLDRNRVTFGETYITLSKRTTVRIHNLSDITARFQWKAVDTQGEEELKLRRYHRLCQLEKDKFRDLEACGVDTTRRELFPNLIRRLQSEKAKAQGDPVLFKNDIFSIEPKEGEIRPNCWAEISVFFKPREARVYEQAGYCDISGREKRLPLHLIGEGLGPRLRFSYEELDIGEVFLTANLRYKTILLNRGLIAAPFSLVPPTTAMGSCFTFLTQEGVVAPNGLQDISISFHPTIQGAFEERFQFSVAGSPTPAILTIKGFVMAPTLRFDVPALHFGDVSYGFPRTLKCRLFNTSLVPLDVNLHIPGDGPGQPSVESADQMLRLNSQSWRKEAQGVMKPREFAISPCRVGVLAQGSADIQVTLCSNTVRNYKLELVVDVDGVGKNVLALTLTASTSTLPGCSSKGGALLSELDLPA